MELNAVVLAAGKGTRMKSRLQKVLHKVNDKPMVYYVVKMIKESGISNPVIVVGYQSDKVEKVLRGFGCKYVYQRKRLGTGHAVKQAEKILKNESGYSIVVNGDCPFFSKKTLSKLLNKARKTKSKLYITSMIVDDDTKGIVLRDKNNNITGVIEARDASSKQLKIKEKNAGLYLVDNKWLWDHVGKIKKSPVKGEYYITELIQMAATNGDRVDAVVLDDHREALGIDSKDQLKTAEKLVEKGIVK